MSNIPSPSPSEASSSSSSSASSSLDTARCLCPECGKDFADKDKVKRHFNAAHWQQFRAEYNEEPTIYRCGVCAWETRYYDSEMRHEGQQGHRQSLEAAQIASQRTGQPVPSIGWVSALTCLPTSKRAGKSSSGDNTGSASSSSNTMGTTGGSSSTTTTSTAPLSFSAFLHVEAGQLLGSAVLPILAAKLRAKGLTVDAVAEELGWKEELMGKVFRGHICPEKQVLVGVARVLGIAKSILMFSFVGGEGWNNRVVGDDEEDEEEEDGEAVRGEVGEGEEEVGNDGGEDNDDDGGEWEVEVIKDHRLNRVLGRYELLVGWVGLDSTQDSWEPEVSILSCSMVNHGRQLTGTLLFLHTTIGRGQTRGQEPRRRILGCPSRSACPGRRAKEEEEEEELGGSRQEQILSTSSPISVDFERSILFFCRRGGEERGRG